VSLVNDGPVTMQIDSPSPQDVARSWYIEIWSALYCRCVRLSTKAVGVQDYYGLLKSILLWYDGLCLIVTSLADPNLSDHPLPFIRHTHPSSIPSIYLKTPNRSIRHTPVKPRVAKDTVLKYVPVHFISLYNSKIQMILLFAEGHMFTIHPKFLLMLASLLYILLRLFFAYAQGWQRAQILQESGWICCITIIYILYEYPGSWICVNLAYSLGYY
ncbi:hypothetical protein ACJX0J_004706, partial [Zea mays]